jgi:nitrous-oxide reductase
MGWHWTYALKVATAAAAAPIILAALSGCDNASATGDKPAGAASVTGGGSGMPDVQQVMQARGLSPDDLLAAAKTYTPSGKHDDVIMFASGGHSGQIFVIGVPSMRILRSIAVFTPEPWQGWGYGAGNDVIKHGSTGGKTLTWGDTHHPNLSTTDGDYDGQFLFVNDKANARMAVVDLRDFETKQIIKNPISFSDHGGAVVTPNTDYVIEGGQYGNPLGGDYAPIEDYQKSYRGMVTAWKFDRAKGRLDPEQSFALELPPYWQDLSACGKRVSDGWLFINSINTEMATGGVESGKPAFEAGVSQRDMDYLHVINFKKATELFKAGKFEKVKGFPVIKLDTLVKEGVLHFVPEPKSPHGVDVTPGGEFMIVSGKLDPHVTVFSFEKTMQAIKDKKYSGTDPFGVPILNFDACKEAQVELGLGPLHTQFDDKGYAYTSLFLEPAVCRWSLGGQYDAKNPEAPWTVVGKTSVQYNIGHLSVVGGDTTNPVGKYLVAMNKWSIDRFFQTGPLLPQNFQLLDISGAGSGKMPILYDLPIGVGEPHYAQMIPADRLKPWKAYPKVGWNPEIQAIDPEHTKQGEEKIVRKDGAVHVYTTVVRSHFTPEHVEVNQGEKVVWHLTSHERAVDATHGFCIPSYNVNLSLEPGEYQRFEFVADQAGTFPFYCTEFCSALHLEMMGYFRVKPAAGIANAPAE